MRLISIIIAIQNFIIHAPEEKGRYEVDLTRADVYVMGHVMFYIYTKNWLYEGILEEKALKMLYAGKHTQFPSNLNTTIPANKAMQSAILKSWTHKPKHRPSAHSIRNYLLQELSSITGQTSIQPGDDLLKVEVPPLPRDHRYSGSSMDGANEGDERMPLQLEYNNEP